MALRLDPKIITQILVPITGLLLIAHEALIYRGPERYGLIMLYAGMIGVTMLLRGSDQE